MFTNIKPMNNRGRNFQASEIFVDDKKETIIDTIYGFNRFSFTHIFGIILILIHIMSGNFFGVAFASFCFTGFYFIGGTGITQTYTLNRLVEIKKFKYPILKKIALFLLIPPILKIISFLNILPNVLFYNININEKLYVWIELLPILAHQFLKFQVQYSYLLQSLDTILTCIIYLWMFVFFTWKESHFLEVNLSQISDLLVTQKKITSLQRLIVLSILDLIILLVIHTPNFLFLILVFILHSITPRRNVYEVFQFGHSGRVLASNIILEEDQLFRLRNITAGIFGWSKKGDSTTYPYKVIPKEVVSFYETGLRASLNTALRNGNNLGAITSSFINLIIGIQLLILSSRTGFSDIVLLLGIFLTLILVSVGLWIAFQRLGKIQQDFQKEESLMIGHGFIGRWFEPNLWIIKGDKLEGKRNRISPVKSIFSYERVSGFNVAWRTILILVPSAVVIIFTIFWISVGALNLSKAVFILPFLFNLGFSFLTVTANAQLGFFMIISFLLWMTIYYFYPRYYSLSRPRMTFNLEHLSTISVIFKDKEDLEDASNQFVKCIISSSRPKRRKTVGRPGSFLFNIDLIGYYSPDLKQEIQFSFGENKQLSPVLQIIPGIPNATETRLHEDLRVSAMQGFPQVHVIANYDDNGKKTKTIDTIVEIENLKEYVVNLETQNGLKFSLRFTLVKVDT